jgi:hypothetical protein
MRIANHRATLGLAGLLAVTCIGVPLVNADAGPPRALFLRLPADIPEPTVALAARASADGRWMLDIAATGFRFTDLCIANAAAVPVGHAHVFRGEQKLATAYLPVVDLGRLGPGVHEIRVVLRGQDHRALVGRSGLVEASTIIAVPGPEVPDHLAL